MHPGNKCGNCGRTSVTFTFCEGCEQFLCSHCITAPAVIFDDSKTYCKKCEATQEPQSQNLTPEQQKLLQMLGLL